LIGCNDPPRHGVGPKQSLYPTFAYLVGLRCRIDKPASVRRETGRAEGGGGNLWGTTCQSFPSSLEITGLGPL